MNFIYHDLYYTVIKNRKEIEVVDIENDNINFHDLMTPNHYTAIKPRETILK